MYKRQRHPEWISSFLHKTEQSKRKTTDPLSGAFCIRQCPPPLTQLMAQGRHCRVIAFRNSYSITADFTVTGDCQHDGYFESSKHGLHTHPSHKRRINQNEIMFWDAIKLCYFYYHTSPINIYDGWKTILTLSWEIFCHYHHFVCLTTYPYHFPKRVHKAVRHGASSFDFRHPVAA